MFSPVLSTVVLHSVSAATCMVRQRVFCLQQYSWFGLVKQAHKTKQVFLLVSTVTVNDPSPIKTVRTPRQLLPFDESRILLY